MIFRQLFDSTSSTYTYLLASRPGGEALIIDPVLDRCDRYIQLLEELDLKLVKAIDTHCHADHITGLGALRDATRCITVMGQSTNVDMVSMRVDDGDSVDIENISLQVLFTPGHTDDSYCFLADGSIFTGDTLLIRGTGRTDFQNGSSFDAYQSLFEKVLKLPEDTKVYPGHDYKGDTVSTIGEEKAYNPRLQVASADEYAELMAGLSLANPKMMDVAVPANLSIGKSLVTEPDILEGTIDVKEALSHLENKSVLFVDLRETPERQRMGFIPGSLHAPYLSLEQAIGDGGLLNGMLKELGKSVVLYCAYGERSALALKVVKEKGFLDARHLGGGMEKWTSAGAPTSF